MPRIETHSLRASTQKSITLTDSIKLSLDQRQNYISGASTVFLRHYITCNLADAFIQSELHLIRLSRRHTPWSNEGLKGLAQAPNSCADVFVATPGIKQPTLQVQVK